MGTAFDIKSVKGCLLWEEGQPRWVRTHVNQSPPRHPLAILMLVCTPGSCREQTRANGFASY